MNKNINELIEYPKEGVLSKELIKTKKVNISLFCMAKGTDISEHTSTKEGFIYVLEGDGVFNLYCFFVRRKKWKRNLIDQRNFYLKGKKKSILNYTRDMLKKQKQLERK